MPRSQEIVFFSSFLFFFFFLPMSTKARTSLYKPRGELGQSQYFF